MPVILGPTSASASEGSYLVLILPIPEPIRRQRDILVTFDGFEAIRSRKLPKIALLRTNAAVAFVGLLQFWQLDLEDEVTTVAVATIRDNFPLIARHPVTWE
jgi:hypothetical protein